jgi:hypothetical protein
MEAAYELVVWTWDGLKWREYLRRGGLKSRALAEMLGREESSRLESRMREWRVAFGVILKWR